MGLIDLQRQILSLCFEETPSEATLAELGQRDAWLTYREMIRDRLLRELRIALPRTRVLVGDDAFHAAFAHYLARQPPRTRFFRELVNEFVASTLPLWAAD
ncbi:MAG TPA: putative DNA-binding domain-containing protein, partial [Polyangiales bacterium]|nr:putative DNA-binding domain-containing protein [Polyangiales bacterium]